MRGGVGPKRLLTQLLHTLHGNTLHANTLTITHIYTHCHTHACTLVDFTQTISALTLSQVQGLSHRCLYIHPSTHTYKHTCSCQLAVPQPCTTGLRREQGDWALTGLCGVPTTALPISFLYGGRPQHVRHRLVGKNLCTAKSVVARLDMAGDEVTCCRVALKGCPDVEIDVLLSLRRPCPPCWCCGAKEGKGPWAWHLQIEDQVVEALFRDAVMETYCRDREVMRSRR